MQYQVVIGLEVHAQLSTETKLFCRCKNAYGQEPNSATCPTCLALPGALPRINNKAIELAVQAGHALNCSIQAESIFDRKNYFYPDLPKGYQISQFYKPICLDGFVQLEDKKIELERIHMEEDAGKLIHEDGAFSLVDLNRSGVPLIEIVSKPQIESAAQASEYLKKIRQILRYANVCDGNMQEGSLRCDANVSIMPKGSKVFGTRAEIKNLNSFKHVEKAIEYEIQRQTICLNNQEKVVQETRLWNESKNITLSMRGKENSHDYRYFPEPDLKPLHLDTSYIEQLKTDMPELPSAMKERFIEDMHLPEYDADVLTQDKSTAVFFQDTVDNLQTILPKHSLKDFAKTLSNFMMSEVLRISKEQQTSINKLKFSAKDLADLLSLVITMDINNNTAKEVVVEMSQTGQSADKIVESKGLKQVNDASSIEPMVIDIIANNPGQVEQYKSGKDRLFGFFVGQVMKASKGKANPSMVNDLIKKHLQ